MNGRNHNSFKLLLVLKKTVYLRILKGLLIAKSLSVLWRVYLCFCFKISIHDLNGEITKATLLKPNGTIFCFKTRF